VCAAVVALLSVSVPNARAVPGLDMPVRQTIVRLPIEESPGLHFHRLSTADGLSQARVGQIIQDDLGFVWFGTQYGLNRYDGYDFKLYVHEPGNPLSAAGTFVYSLFKDRDGFIWIGWSRGLDRLDPRADTFTHYFAGEDEPTGTVTVVHISQDRQGILWLATGSGLRGFNPATKTVLQYRHSADPNSLPADDINWTGEDSKGRFWVGTSKGLSEFDRKDGRVLRTIWVPEPFKISLFEDHRGQFWITTATGTGLALFDPEKNIVTPYSYYDADPGPIGSTGVVSIAEDAEGNLWLASSRFGLLRLDRTRRRVQHFGNRLQDQTGLAGNDVVTLLQDRGGNIWTGLNSGGVNYFGKDSQQFEVFRHVPGDPNSLSRDFVNAILKDRDDTLWIGNYSGLNRIDRKTGRRELVDIGLARTPTVISLVQDHEGAIWAGTFAHGVTRYDPQKKTFENFMHDASNPRSLSNNEVHRVFVDHEKTVWVATDDGLNRFDPATHSFTVYKTQDDNRFGQGYLSIAEDAKGNLWLGTAYSGLHRFDRARGQVSVYRQKGDGPDGLRDNGVQSVLISRLGQLWLGTQNGLQSLDFKTGALRSYDTRNGMPANAVSCLLEDERGNIWMSTTKGLSKLAPETATFTNYSMVDELGGNDLTGWDACAKSHAGELFFAGFDGAVGFFPTILKGGPPASPLVLTDIEIDGAAPRIGREQPLEHAIAYAKSVTLSHKQSSLSLTFAGLNYGNSNATRYRYRLDGFDQEWHVSPSSIRQATYTMLPTGRYTLNVQMASDRGDWQAPGLSLAILVLPPWWATWWFRGLCVLVLAALGWWIVRAREQYITREVTLQMEARNNERMRIAGDLHDTLLQGLMGASFQISVVQDQLAPDAKARPLLDHISDLLRQLVAEGRNVVRGLRTWNFDRNDLERAIASVPGDLQIESAAEYRLAVIGDARPLLPAARNEVYLIAREAISNALRHAEASTIEVTIEYLADSFQLTVRDDGLGFVAGSAPENYPNHFGLAIMTERATRLNGTLKISSGAGLGTEITLAVPAHALYQPRRAGAASRTNHD
jgi:ligand-binding sensor domain-containing protein/signal transduction histidine kinase